MTASSKRWKYYVENKILFSKVFQ